MKSNCLIVFLNLFFVWAGAAGAKPTCDKVLAARVGNSLKSGKGVIIVVWDAKSKCGDDDEACGDWAGYLNAASEKRNEIEVFKIPTKTWDQVVLLEKDRMQERSTLFMKSGKPSFMATDPILEPQVYRAVFGLWSGHLGKEDGAFLPKTVSAVICK